MAFIRSREVQENIVGPLMDMMGQLSTEMRKNLSYEVSNIGMKVDELSSKVDHLINIVERNAGNHMFVSETPVIKTQIGNSFSRLNASCSNSDENSLVSKMIDNDKISDEKPLLNETPQKEITNCKSDNYSAQCSFNTGNEKIKENTQSIRENGKDPVPNEEYNGLENTSNIKKLSEEIPIKSDDDDEEEQGEEEGESDDADDEDDDSHDEDENVSKTEREVKSVPNANDKVNTTTLQRDVETEAEFISNDNNGCIEIGNISTEQSSSNESFSGSKRDKTERHNVNFGLRKAPKRPESPIPKSATKVNIPYANFKKSKTEFALDNRTMYLKDAFNIVESGTVPNTAKLTDVVKNRSNKNVDQDVDKNVFEPPDKRETTPVTERVPKNTEDAETPPKRHSPVSKRNDFHEARNNNHKLSASGLHNEHCDDDNRFNAAAHEDAMHVSMTRRHYELSNHKVIKNGPKLLGGSAIGDDTDQTKPKDTVPKLVSDDVLHSLIEKERISASECKDVKSTGIDTVICLDTSASMAGKPLTAAITCIEKILDGFETNAIYHGLEENVALVTFGNENKIRNHLTNDYIQIRDGLAGIKAGGPSPLWLGLALSLTEIKERGGACVMEPMSVLPRIILITDGYASRKNCLNGDDNGLIEDQVIREMLSLMETCKSFTSFIECIKSGNCHEKFLKSLSSERMYTTDEIESITEFFKIQEKANTIIKQVKSAEIKVAEINEVIENSKLNENGKEDLRRILSASLPSSDEQPPEPETKPQSEDEPAEADIRESEPVKEQDVSLPPESLDLSDDVKAPPFGTAVLPNPEWIGFATRHNFIGTVVGTRKKGSMKILWSDGTIDRCKFGVDGQYDILVSEDQSVDCDKIHIGSLVVRGQDWRWKDQDGGEGNVGVVTKIDGPVVHVIWSHGGIGNYRYGYNKKFDLTLRNYRTEKRFAWYMEEESDLWKMFPKHVSDSIEQMYKSKQAGTFLVKMDSQSLRISLQNLQARDTTNTQTSYNIERREISEEEWLAVNNEL